MTTLVEFRGAEVVASGFVQKADGAGNVGPAFRVVHDCLPREQVGVAHGFRQGLDDAKADIKRFQPVLPFSAGRLAESMLKEFDDGRLVITWALQA